MQQKLLKENDVFISYGRAESKAFATKLYNRLLDKGLKVWFDQNDIPLGVDFQQQINDGIEKADNFIFIIAPHSIKSEYCLKEVVLALKHNKRIIPILHIEPKSKEVWDKLHPTIGKLNWIYCRDELDASKPMEEWVQIDDFDKGFVGLMELIESYKNYVEKHTDILIRAMDWANHQRSDQYFLDAEQHKEAKEWMLVEFKDTQAPCIPTNLQCEFVSESEKYLNQGQTTVFFSYAREDAEVLAKVKKYLLRFGITTWTDTSDIKTGVEFEVAIRNGIEKADNFLYLLSPESVKSEYCLMELKYVRKYNKRVIPLLVKETPDETIPPEVRQLQYLTLIGLDEEKQLNEFGEILNIVLNDNAYYRIHKEVLVSALEWESQGHPPNMLLHGFKLEEATEWLEDNEKRKNNVPTSLQKRFIKESQSSRISLFISYGRKHSKDFATKLHENLANDGYNVWFDQNDIPLGVDFQEQIDNGIENADNFIFIISPHAVKSEYCLKEIVLAVNLKKRIIPLLHMEPSDCWDKMHPTIEKLNWIYFQEGVNDFNEGYVGLTTLLQSHAEYVKKHTRFQTRALEWSRNKKSPSLLLVGNDRQESENWLKTTFKKTQPPTYPTEQQAAYICESKKNANNMMTDVFLAYAREDAEDLKKLRTSLTLESVTSWSDQTDIKTGVNFEEAINTGIEQADNFIFLITPNSVKSEFCIKELNYVMQLGKRIIPIYLRETDNASIPKELSQIQFIDFSTCIDNKEVDTTNQHTLSLKERVEKDVASRKGKLPYDEKIDELIGELAQEKEYFNQHKIFLSKALKWERQKRNNSILLRGYNLQGAEAWVKIGKTRKANLPLPIHEEFVAESRAQDISTTTEIFLSYSRANSDFARALNDELQTSGKTTWFDQESIASGTDFAGEINKGIENSDNFVFVITNKAIKSEYCGMEVEFAKKLNKRFITLLYEEVDVEDLHPELASVQWINFKPDETDFHSAFNELLRTLDTDREHVQSHTKWQQRAKAWESHGKRPDRLLRGTEFEVAEKWLVDANRLNKTPKTTALQNEFVKKSREAILAAERRELRRRRIIRIMLIVMSILFFLALVAGIFVRIAQKEAVEQKEEAVRQEKIAKEQEKIAKEKTKYAEVQKGIADLERDTAKLQREIADKEKVKAILSADEARRQRDYALKQEKIAGRERDTARMQKMYANEQRDTAELQKLRALEANNRSMFHLYEFNAKEFANKAITMQETDENRETKALLALTGFELKQEAVRRGTEGNFPIQYSPEILEALQKATMQYENDKLISGEAWAMDSKKGNISFSDKEGNFYITKVSKPKGKQPPAFNIIQQVEIGKTEFVNTLSFNGKGNKVGLGTSDGNVLLYDIGSNESKKLYKHEKSTTSSLTFVPNRDLLISSATDNTMKFWNLNSGSEINKINLNAPIRSLVAVSKSELVGAINGKIAIFNLDQTDLSGVTDEISSRYKFYTLAFNEYYKWLIAGTISGEIFVVKLDRGNYSNSRLVKFPQKHEGMVSAISYSPDNQWMASASYDGTIQLWYLQDVIKKGIPKMTPLVIDNERNKIFSVTFDKSSKYVIFGDMHDLHIRPLDPRETYDRLRKRFGKKTLSDDDWNYYKKGALKKPPVK